MNRSAQWMADNMPIASTVASSALGVVGSVGALGETVNSMVTKEPYDPRSEGISNYADALRQDVTENIGSGAGRLAYTVGTGIMDIGVSAAMMGQKAVKWIFGLRGADSEIKNARARGANNEQALALGAIAGSIEVITESVGMDRLFSRISGQSPVSARRIIADMLSEGAEEIPGNVVTPIADSLIMGDKAQMALQADNLVKSGQYTQQEAEKKVLYDQIASTAYESVVAGLTAGAMEGPAAIANKAMGVGKDSFTFYDPS
jgi:hypothetical protein